MVVIALAGASLWLALGRDDARSPDDKAPPRASAPAPTPIPRYQLVVELRGVRARGVTGVVAPRRVRAAARAVRETIDQLYSIGFVDTSAWQEGQFPSLFGLFERSVRGQVGSDLRELTLGPAAKQLDAVRPERARLWVRFLTDAAKRPTAAFARMEFEGTAVAAQAELPVRHGGDLVLRRVAGRWRIVSYEVRGRIPTPGEVRTEVRKASLTPELPAPELLFVLVIGSDARPGQSVTNARADSLHIVGVNPQRGRASIVGIPRDSFVYMPGHGTDKINASLALGGPELVVRTVERLAGIDVDAYVLTGFAGFHRIVSSIGGLPINIRYEMGNPSTNAHFGPGRTRLTGGRALAYSRNRHDAHGGDFGRSYNQGRLIIAALEKLQRDLRADPSNLVPWIVAAARDLDTDLSFGEMLDLLLAVRSIDAGRVRNVVVSGDGATIGGRSVVLLGDRARAVFRDLADDAMLRG